VVCRVQTAHRCCANNRVREADICVIDCGSRTGDLDEPLNQHSYSVSDWWNGLIGVGASFVGWHYDYVPDPSRTTYVPWTGADAV